METSEAWKCAICCELLHKPVANVCGHLFCFWCLHRSMNAFTESRCPLCRTKYGHLPHVISKLHSFLKAVFPEEYLQRELENEEEEKQEEVASPDLSNAPPAKSTPATIAKEDFLCDVCDKLLYKPTVLTCGHVVCSTCLDGGSTPPTGNTTTNDSTDDGIAKSTTALRYECACGVCGQPLVHRPTPCRQLEDLIKSVFSEEYTTREALVQKEREEKPALDAAAAEQVVEVEATPAIISRQATQATEAETTTQATEQPSSQAGEGLDVAFPPLTGPHAQIFKWLQGKDYPHFGIGCDCCGQFPITGRRYRCKDCPEAVGFDLCGDCYDRGVSTVPNSKAVVGRFNQQHKKAHEMELCRPRLTSLHMLRAANPELSFDQLMYLLQVSTERENDDEEEGGEEEEEGGDEGGSDSGEGEEVEEVESEIPMPHGRGPRPVQDASTQWPSPSSFDATGAQPSSTSPPPPPPSSP